MSIQTRTTLKGYFETGDTPTQAQFADLIDSMRVMNSAVPDGNDLWLQGGNAFGTTAVIGTTDNQPVDFYANNGRKGRLFANGNWLFGTGTTDAGYKLDVQGTFRATGQIYTSGGGIRCESPNVIGWHNAGQGLRTGFTGGFGAPTYYSDAFYGTNPDAISSGGNRTGILLEHASDGRTYISNVSDLNALRQIKIGRNNNGGTAPNSGVLVSGEASGASNLSGSNISIRAGASTGDYAGANGNVLLQTSDATSSGSTQQSYTTKVAVWKNGAVSIGLTALHASAKFEVQSTNRGAIPAPKMTEAQRDAISSPTEGLMVYNLDAHKYQFHNGTSWTDL